MEQPQPAYTDSTPHRKSGFRKPNSRQGGHLLNRLTMMDIVRATGMNRSALIRYLQIPENRRLLGAEGDPPTYPEENINIFHRLHLLHEAGTVKPLTLAGTFDVLFRDDQSLPVRFPNTEPDTLAQGTHIEAQFLPDTPEGITLLREMVELLRLTSRDELLTTQQAATVLKCHPSNIRRTTGLTPARKGRPNLYLMSEIQAYLRSLRHRPDAPLLSPPPDDSTDPKR